MKKYFNRFLQFKYRLLITIVLIAILFISIGFFVIYSIFISKLEEQTQRFTLRVFEQTEKNLKLQLHETGSAANSIVANRDADDFFQTDQLPVTAQTMLDCRLVTMMNTILSSDETLFSIAIVNKKGRALGATNKRTLSEIITPDSGLHKLFLAANKGDGTTVWLGGESVAEYFNEDDPESVLLDTPVLIGVREIKGNSDDVRNYGYVIITVREKSILNSYSQILYDGNTTMIADKNGTVLSCGNQEMLGSKIDYFNKIGSDSISHTFDWVGDKDYKIISYYLEEYEWTLINQIPYRVFTLQAATIRRLVIVVSIVTVFLLVIFFVLWIFRYTKPIENLIERMKKIEQGNLLSEPMKKSGISELDLAGKQLCSMARELDLSITRIKAVEEQKRIEELKTLQYQINPHFLYNSLNSIRWMAMMSGAPNVAEVLVTLVKIIMPILKSPSFFWTVSEEIEFSDNYVKMMRLRYGASMKYELTCDEELYAVKFPRFILQPIIENCFAHGLKVNEVFCVSVSLKLCNNLLTVTILDNGNGIDEVGIKKLNESLEMVEVGEVSGDNIGLRNVNKRLFLIYKGHSKMWIESVVSEGTMVKIMINIASEFED